MKFSEMPPPLRQDSCFPRHGSEKLFGTSFEDLLSECVTAVSPGARCHWTPYSVWPIVNDLFCRCRMGALSSLPTVKPAGDTDALLDFPETNQEQFLARYGS